ncbi:MAG TPA: branched-chain amino acid ABC transporter permease [Candidatus Methylomirabilis sp.]|nr:branched-chain amino acid ABC transporter permease [Candidatus Methylomirabilis sp.]
MDYFISVGVFTAITTLGVLGTFVLTGLTGLFSLGQAAFMGLGAYVAALAVVKYGIPFPLAVALAVLLSLAVAYVIGYATLKIRQDFFALVTFGFGEALRAIMDESVKYTGGAMGFSGVPQLTTPWLAIGSLVAAVWLIRNVRNSKFGRDCLAIRTDELAAQVSGINAFGHKLKVFLLGAGLSSFAGALMAFFTTYVEPAMFGWIQSAIWIIMVFVGGRDSLTGAIVGATVLSALPEILRFASQWRVLIYCVIILLIINFRPAGLFGRWELSLENLGLKRRVRPEASVEGAHD